MPSVVETATIHKFRRFNAEKQFQQYSFWTYMNYREQNAAI